jgi:translation initiation factor 2 beta subunit (eIF-2beta)/eIF-5
VAAEVCQYCGVDLDETPPRNEVGYLYAVECSRCPPHARRLQMLPRRRRVAEVSCPACGARLAEEHPDVLVVKEMTYEVCAACGERCGVVAVRKLRDVSGGMM